MIRTIALTLAVLLGLPLAAIAAPAKYVIDPDHFAVIFSVTHIGYQKVPVWMLKGEGSFVFDEETRALSDLVVTIDANAVFSNHKARDNHIRSKDFLDAVAHPEIRFVMTGAEPTGERTGLVKGDLTVRGMTQPVTLDVVWNKSGAYPWGNNYAIGISAKTAIKRSAFGSTYALEGDIVGDAVEISIELEAIRQE